MLAEPRFGVALPAHPNERIEYRDMVLWYLIQNSGDFVGGCGDGLGGSQPGADASEKLAEASFGTAERIGAHT